MAEVAVNCENIIGTLMVGNKDVGRMGIDVLPTAYLYFHPGHGTEYLCPDFSGPVAPEAASAQHAPDDGKCCSKYCGNKEHGHHYAKLVYAVKYHGCKIFTKLK